MICPECQTEVAPGAKFCRKCGEQLPSAETLPDTRAGTGIPSPPVSTSAPTVAAPAIPYQKPVLDAFKTVAGQAVAPSKPPEAFKTVVAPAAPLPPPETFKTTVSPTLPKADDPAASSRPGTMPGGREQPAAVADSSGNRFVSVILILAVLGFLAGLTIFFGIYVFGEKPPSATARVGVELLDDAINHIELCSFWMPPNEPNPFDNRNIANAFPAGVRAVALRLSGQLPTNSDCRIIWRRVESPVPLMAQAVPALGENQPVIRLLYQPDGQPLPTGAYVAEVQDGDRPLARAYFTVGLSTRPQ